MADESDVENALGAYIAGAIYPSGTASPSIANVPVRLRRGQPLPNEIDDDIKAGAARVSVLPQPGHTRNTTRYPQKWHRQPLVAPTITATSPDNLVWTLGGTSTGGQNIGCLCQNVGYIVAVQEIDGVPDSLTDIATGLAAQITGASSEGPVLTLPVQGTVTVTAIQGATSELRRQEQGFMVCIWAPTAAIRDTLASAADMAVAQISFLALPDQPGARIRYTDTRITDASENSDTYRRDLIYIVEYATIATQQSAPLIFPIGIMQPQGSELIVF